jgi:hypothetical protein
VKTEGGLGGLSLAVESVEAAMVPALVHAVLRSWSQSWTNMLSEGLNLPIFLDFQCIARGAQRFDRR